MEDVTFPRWFVSDKVCALCDSDRHLAHIVKVTGLWFAFDATRQNTQGDGWIALGSFASRHMAMHAAETETLRLAGPVDFSFVTRESPQVRDYLESHSILIPPAPA